MTKWLMTFGRKKLFFSRESRDTKQQKNMEIIKFKAGDKNSNHVQPNTRAEVFIYKYVEPHTVCVCVVINCVFIFLPQ